MDEEIDHNKSPDNKAEKGQKTDATPGVETAKSGSSDGRSVQEAFVSAIEFFHAHLDDEIATDAVDVDTAREYFTDIRGWDAETIDTKWLGYAPPDPSALLDYLMRRGFDREAILGTGLFTEDLQALWRGRYVLPYFDIDGQPVYAISRTVGKHGGGAVGYDGHPADIMSGKYAKPAHTKPYAAVDEPIYGLDSIRDGEPVLITEGIADAITAHEAGYPCISPVTTSFKHDDRQALVDALADRDVSRVFIIQDAERPGSSIDDEGRLTVSQYGPGLKGAVTTGAYLADHADGLDAYLAELPRPGLDKVDLDDYLCEWSDTLAPVLASAKPATSHPAYDAKAVAVDTARREQSRSASTTGNGDGKGDHSAVFDLDIRDVTGLSWDYRGTNPLGHHGDSENYFVLLEEHGLAYDHKYGVAYTPLTYLLCEASERRPGNPNGALNDQEVFVAWRHAKRAGLIGDDDPIPHRALRHVALDTDLCERADLRDGWKLPVTAYNDTLTTVKETYDVHPGRTPIGGDTDTEHVAVLPPAVRDLATAASGWDWRHAGQRETNEKNPLDAARERTTDVLADAMTRSDRVLVEALPTLGKSYGTIAAAATTGEPVTILTTRGNKEQYEQIRDWCDERDLFHYTLPSFTRDCPTANGQHGEDWKRRVRDWYERGATPREIHDTAEYELGRPLPCQEQGTCQHERKWHFDADKFDVLIGHYTHAHVTDVTKGRTVVFDEFPEGAYETKLSHGIEGAVTYFLKRHDALPFDDYTDLVENRHDEARRLDALDWFAERGVDRDSDLVFASDAGHAAAPLAALTILKGATGNLGNGWERSRLDDSGKIGLFNREQERSSPVMSILSPPDLAYASSVLALDGTPTKWMWERALGSRLNHRPVLTESERHEYIRDGLGLKIVRTTDAVKPYSNPDYVSAEEDAALLEAIGEQHGQRPGLITSRAAEEDVYPDAGVLDFVDATEHYGNILGSNEFRERRLGAVIGSRHFGDGFVKKWSAFDDAAVERNDQKGVELSYGPQGDDVLTHMREHETLQAVMRFGRDGNGAVVYVHTNTLPDWVPLAGEGRVLRTWSDGMKQVVRAARDLGTWRTDELAEHSDVEIGTRQVFNVLEDLADRGYVTREYEGRGYTWLNDGLHRVSEYGDVELTPIDIDDTDEKTVQETARSSTYTWYFHNVGADTDTSNVPPAASTESRSSTPVDGGIDPPDRAD